MTEREELRQEYNTAIANGLILKARQMGRRLAVAERGATDVADTPDSATDDTIGAKT